VKKILLAVVALTLVLGACNKKAFLKKLTGTWKLNTYLFDGLDRTVYFDTTFRGYTLDLNDNNEYAINYQKYSFAPDSVILSDTLGYDSVSMAYIISMDTFRYVDTTVTPFLETGVWDLLNSDEDLQLRNDSSNTVSIYRILDLDKSNLKLKKGNEELYLKK